MKELVKELLELLDKKDNSKDIEPEDLEELEINLLYVRNRLSEIVNSDSKSVSEEAEIAINDCYVDCFGGVPSKSQIETIYSKMPEHIKLKANTWGWNDTVVNSNLKVWLEVSMK